MKLLAKKERGTAYGCLEDLTEDLVGGEGAVGAGKRLEVTELLENTLLGGEVLVAEAANQKSNQGS